MALFSEYFKRDHVLSRVDVRVKLMVAAALLVMDLSYRGVAFPLLLLALGTLLSAGMRVPLRVFLLRFSEPAFITLVLVTLKFLFSGSTPLFTVELAGVSVSGYAEGLREGTAIAARVLGAVSVVAVLGFSTPFAEFMSGLSWFRVPRQFIEVLMFAYRYIFVLHEDAVVIYNSQKNRLGYSSMRRGLGSFGILTGSLILKSFEHSQNTTVAMVQRGYDGNIPVLRHKPFRAWEVALSIVVVVLTGMVWKI